MKATRNDHGAYVRKVQEGTQNFAQEILGEIERLQVLVAALEAEKESLADRSARDPRGCQVQRGPSGPCRLPGGRDESPARAGDLAARGERAPREGAGPAPVPAREHPRGEPALFLALHGDRAAELQPRQPVRGELSPPRHPRPQGSDRHHPGDHRQPRSAPRRRVSSSSTRRPGPSSSSPRSGSPRRHAPGLPWAAGSSAEPRRRERSTSRRRTLPGESRSWRSASPPASP